MDRIPLYDVPSLMPPPDIPRRHWQDEAGMTERLLRAFLGLADSADVLLLDRATHGLRLAMDCLDICGTFHIPNRTYRAAWDAADGRNRQLTTLAQLQPMNLTVAIPTTLGGTRPVYLHSAAQFIYDCAHTCYKDMLKDVIFLDDQFLVLSFYPTKPLGAFGGGALIGRREAIEKLRPRAWPVDGTSCEFYYPQSVQSWGIRQRIAEWDDEYWSQRRARWSQTHDWITEHYDLEWAWPQPDGAVMETPHLLALRGPEVELLRRHCERNQIETGNHYPPVNGSSGCPYITVPFHTTEVLTRLGRVTRVPGERRIFTAAGFPPTERGATCPR